MNELYVNNLNIFNEKLKDIEFCALDLETTGPNPLRSRIVEVGLVRFNLKKVVDEYSTLINPEVIIPDDTINVHGITNDMVKSAPFIEDVLDEMYTFLKGAVLVIQNPAFDLSFLEVIFRDRMNTPPLLEAIDTVRLSKKVLPHLKNHKLSTLLDYLGIEIENHRALPDALGCMNVFKHILLLKDPQCRWTLRDLMIFHGNFSTASLKRKTHNSGKKYKNIIVGQQITIEYIDSSGTKTVREILPHEFFKYGKNHYVSAHCYLRDEIRFFNAERITKVIRKSR